MQNQPGESKRSKQAPSALAASQAAPGVPHAEERSRAADSLALLHARRQRVDDALGVALREVGQQHKRHPACKGKMSVAWRPLAGRGSDSSHRPAHSRRRRKLPATRQAGSPAAPKLCARHRVPAALRALGDRCHALHQPLGRRWLLGRPRIS